MKITSVNQSYILLTDQALICAEVQKHERQSTFTKHIYQSVVLYQILSGQCQIKIDNRVACCVEGDFIAIPSNTVYSFNTAQEEPCTYCCIQFDLCFFYRFYLENGREAIDIATMFILSCRSFYKSRTDKKITSLVSQLLEKSSETTIIARASANLYLMELLLHIIEGSDYINLGNSQNLVQNHFIAFTLSYVRKNYPHKILISDIASRLNISTRYLSKVFQCHMNLTILGYINIYRVNQAIELMTNTDDSLTIIASQTGLKDSQHFSKIFKAIIGISPNKYRKLIREKKKEAFR